MKKHYLIVISVLIFLLSSCAILDDIISIEEVSHEVTLIDDLADVKNYRNGALEHILEGELNRRGQAVGFHYDQLPTKKGKIIEGTETDVNEFGVYEAKVIVSDIEKTSNQGMSSFFPDDWDTQDVVDAINEAYDGRTFISGNSYEGLTDEGIIIRMYLDDHDKITSAFPVY